VGKPHRVKRSAPLAELIGLAKPRTSLFGKGFPLLRECPRGSLVLRPLRTYIGTYEQGVLLFPSGRTRHRCASPEPGAICDRRCGSPSAARLSRCRFRRRSGLRQ
jgi:hypothetical protein